MIKKNKRKLLISSAVILLPMLIGIFGGKILPEEIAVHWGFGGEADGYMKASATFIVLPLVLLAFHVGCMGLTDVICKNLEQNKKVMEITFWVIPAISLIACGVILAAAFGYSASLILTCIWVLLALTFVYIGNYMPKTTRNVAMGIKVKWTLASDENWNATHRFAGKVWFILGILCLAAVFLPAAAFPYAVLAMVLIAVIPPILYSYLFYKKQLAEGRITKASATSAYGDLVKNPKGARIAGVILAVLLAILLPILLFAGGIEAEAGEGALTVEATFWSDLSLAYEEIDSVEYRAEGVSGERIGGFGSGKLLLGNFRNDELGLYTRYTYTGSKACILIKSGERSIVIGAESNEATRALYDAISEKCK